MCAPPAVVFEDLAASEPGPRYPRAQDEDLERALLRRDDPLINLALARYGRAGDVVGALLEKGFGEVAGEDDAAYRRGLRVSGYANDRVAAPLFSRGGLLQAIGAEERAPEIFRTGDLDELVTLLRNPEVGEETLAQLFDGRGPFQGLPDERWCDLVVRSQ